MEITAVNVSIVIIWLMCEILGNPLLVGIVHFEKYREDPMKRNLIDMLYTAMFFSFIMTNIFVAHIKIWAIVIGPVAEIIGYIYYISRTISVVFTSLILIETTVIRLLADKLWKRPPPMNDEFFNLFLTMSNVLIGFCVSITHFITGQATSGIARIVGMPIEILPKLTINVRIMGPLVGLLALLGLSNLVALAFGKLSAQLKRCCAWRRRASGQQLSVISRASVVLEIPPIEHEISIVADLEIQGALNNQAKNTEFITSTFQIILVFLVACISVPTAVAIVAEDRGLISDPNILTLVDFGRFFAIFIVTPGILYARNKKLRKHVKIVLDYWRPQ